MSAHLLIIDPNEPFGKLRPPGYKDELLHLAKDVADRLMPAFRESSTGIPYPRVNLRRGHTVNEPAHSPETCTAGAGSLVLEMGLLSRLLGDPSYEQHARKASRTLWQLRSKTTGLPGKNTSE